MKIAIKLSLFLVAKFPCVWSASRAFKALSEAPFHPCNSTHPMSRAEVNRAQALSSRIFAQCLPRILQDTLIRFKVPRFAMAEVQKSICLSIHIVSATVSSPNSKTMLEGKNGTKREDLLRATEHLMIALERSGFSKTIRYGSRVSVLTPAVV